MSDPKQERRQKRVTVYMPEEDYNKLQSKLRRIGKTVSGWFRELADRYLSEE